MPYAFEQATLADLIAFDRQLQELVLAGVPLQWSARSSTAATSQHSKRVVQGFLQQAAPLATAGSSTAGSTKSTQAQPNVTTQKDVWDRFASDSSLSPGYRLSFAAWLATDHHPDSLMILKDIRTEHPSTNIGWAWTFYLKLLLVIAAMTFFAWQWTGGSALRELYQGSTFPPGPVGRITTTFNASFQDWCAGLSQNAKAIGLAAILVSIYFLFRTPKKNRNYRFWLPEESERMISEIRFVETLRNLGFPIDQATDLMKRASERRLAPQPEAESPPASDWLKLSANQRGTKRRLELQLHKRSSIKPLLLYIGIGGLVTLLLAILIFLPMYEYVYRLDVEKRF